MSSMASSSSTSSTLCDKDREDSAASLLEVEAGREATEGGIPLMSGPEAVRQWSRDLAKFADLNWKAHDTSFQDGIEDLNLRLEEFEHLLEMTSSDSSKCLLKQMPLIVAKYEQMETVFDKIDKLELMVARIKSDMDKVDRQLVLAEGTVEGSSSAATLKSYMPAFLVSKSSAPPPAFEDNSPEYSPVDIFSTEDFFPKQESSNSGGSTS